MTDPLAGSHESHVKTADRSSVVKAARRRNAQGPWLPSSNVYERNPNDRIATDVDQSSIRPRQLADYLAASAVGHCGDGWGYIGRALVATAVGDGDVARHLAYYAELRAALSLLASEGIGVFDRSHAVATGYNGARGFRGQGTHVMTWQILDWWIGRPSATQLLSDIVKPEGVPVNQWISQIPSAGPWEALGGSWMRQWGLDLRNLAADRVQRNAASYRPSVLPPSARLASSETAKFLSSWWELFVPQGYGAFDKLDRHLLRHAIHQGFKSPHPDDIDYAVETVPSSPVRHLSEFLKAAPADSGLENILGLAANMTDTRATATHHLQVISRATLLLRLATGATHRLYQEAGVELAEFEFWWSALGERRGFWPPTARPDPLTDLWQDVELALEEVFQQVERPEESSYHRMMMACGSAINVLGGCERVALWALT